VRAHAISRICRRHTRCSTARQGTKPEEEIMEETAAAAPEAAKSQWKEVFTIVERPGYAKKVWLRIGTAFVNRDQSLTVKLDAMPSNSQLHIRDANPSYFGRETRGEGFPARNDNFAPRSDGFPPRSENGGAQ
jgi:hypothetical protein